MITSTQRDLSVLFDPRSVAILGASNDETKYGNWISAQAITMGARDVHLINRRGEPVLGRPTYRTLADVGSQVDLVVIAVPVAGFEQAVEDSLHAGARAIVGITAGFAELGEEGRALQRRIVERVRSAGALLVGPNCLGVLDTSTGLHLASNKLPAGRVALLSQSGNIALELSQFLTARGQGFSRFVSVGNQADVSVADMVLECVHHQATDVIAIYCEDFGVGREFVAACAAAARAGKSVLLLTVGGSEASVRGAASHTGALTSTSDVIDAACRAAGVRRVATPRQLADTAAVLLSYGNTPVRRIVVLADGGGHAGVASDIAESVGLAVPEFSPQISARLRNLLPSSAMVCNPVDLASAGGQDISSFTRVLDTLLADPENDAVLVTGYFGGYGEYGQNLATAEVRTATEMAQAAHRHGKPVVVHTTHHASAASAELTRGGVPVFAAVEDAANALAGLGQGNAPRTITDLTSVVDEPLISDDYWQTRQVFQEAGIAFPAAALVHGHEEALAAAAEIGYPVVLKAMGLLHKSDSGGVALGLTDSDQLTAEIARMQHVLAPSSFTIEAMADTRHAVELIVGVQTDPRFALSVRLV